MRTACVFLIILFFFAEYSVNGTHSAADQQFLGKDSERTDIAFLFGKARVDDPFTAVGGIVFLTGTDQFLPDIFSPEQTSAENDPVRSEDRSGIDDAAGKQTDLFPDRVSFFISGASS